MGNICRAAAVARPSPLPEDEQTAKETDAKLARWTSGELTRLMRGGRAGFPL